MRLDRRICANSGKKATQWQKFNCISTYTYYWNKYNVDKKKTYTLTYSRDSYDDAVRQSYIYSSYSYDTSTGQIKGVDLYADKIDNGWPESTLKGKYSVGERYDETYKEYCGTLTEYTSWKSYGVVNYKIYFTTITEDDIKGSYISEITSSMSNAYPNNGASGGYWYTYNRNTVTYSKGTTLYGTVKDKNANAYPANGRHSDGYWYVKIS